MIALVVPLCGCAATSTTGGRADVEPEVLYSFGASRTEIETQFGAAPVVWVAEQMPADEFAAATMREMVSLRRPRPTTYQVFRTRRLDVPSGYYSDYVFYNAGGRVMYVARRR